MQQMQVGTVKGDSACSGGRRKVKVKKQGKIKKGYITSIVG